jgi:hypothetical protein
MQTKIINVGDVEKYFGFIPPHGVTLDVNGEVTIDGDLRSVLGAGGRAGRYNRSRELAALQAACDAGEICLVEVADGCCSSSSSA